MAAAGRGVRPARRVAAAAVRQVGTMAVVEQLYFRNRDRYNILATMSSRAITRSISHHHISNIALNTINLTWPT